ncbi:hypothetical protein [Leeuwenhoekiella sp. H156]|uniref:hypothetical protein n=1 Tax=Leeuwenhoekiella sp. H156 TaxID=3450128 RepID=UPI003FA49887
MQQKKLTQQRSKSLLAGSLIAAFIVASPYFFYLYEGVPDIEVWNFSFLGIELSYSSRFYESANVAAWIIFGKAFPLIFLIIWFFTCKHWWYHSLLIPIFMYGYQIYGTIADDMRFKDNTFDIIYLGPLIFIALIFLYTIRMKIFDRIHNIDLSELERVTLKGEIKDEDEKSKKLYSDSYDDDDEEPLFMG